jgi:3'-phosphoadenosine 5'-phosphosulfate sulfotransferase
MGDEGKCEPDYSSTLVWSSDYDKWVSKLLAQNGGDVNRSLKKLFGDSTSYAEARILAERFAKLFGLTIGQFMWKYFAWRRGEL